MKDSDEKDDYFAQPMRYTGHNDYGDRDTKDFRIKVDIPYFNGNLNIKEFLDQIAEIDRFFKYMEIPKGKRVRLVACCLQIKSWSLCMVEKVIVQKKS